MLSHGYCVTSTPVLGGLHCEYSLEKEAASCQIEFLRSTGVVKLKTAGALAESSPAVV